MKSKSGERNEIKNERKQNFKIIIFSATTNININTNNVNPETDNTILAIIPTLQNKL